MNEHETLVFDTGPLSRFAREGWLGVLKAVVGDRTAVIPDVVVAELVVGAANDSRISTVLDATWIKRRQLTSDDEIAAFAQFASLLVKGTRNRGEAGVLALAQTLGAVAVIDDAAGRRTAEHYGIPLRPTLALLCEAIRDGLLTIELVSKLADDLIISDYRLPFQPGQFARWAKDAGLLP
jgi:predicted nucleic acid-binding protein